MTRTELHINTANLLLEGIAESMSQRQIGPDGILKAVQECTNIPNNIKMLAAEKCIRLGFKPFVNWDE